MSYLNNYLRVIPKADANIIRENMANNKELFEIKNISEQEYELLIDHLIENEGITSEPLELSHLITAEQLNDFYSNVAMDLHKLFPEQNNIEKLGANYQRIYEGHLEELSNEIEKIRYSVDRLSNKEQIQENVKVISYSFEPDLKSENSENYTEDTAYLFTDRDGSEVSQASQEKLFHTYHLTLKKTESIDLLVNDSGITTAKLEVVYESPHTIPNENPEYHISKAIDGDASTFWFNVAQRPDNSIDTVNIMPGRTKEELKHVRNKNW